LQKRPFIAPGGNVSATTAHIEGEIPSSSTSISKEQMALLRQKIRETVLALGGYWSPLSAVARVLEELGELAELLSPDRIDNDRMAAELADLFIITTCIADQYCVTVNEHTRGLNDSRPAVEAISGTSWPRMFYLLSERAGRLGRLVNALEGDKCPKPDEERPTIAAATASLQATLVEMFHLTGRELVASVSTALDMNIKRDKARFKAHWDPTTALSLERFRPLIANTLCPFAQQAKVWGAPDYDEHMDVAHNISRIAPVLTRFCRIARSQALDGFVIRLTSPAHIRDIHSFSHIFRVILAELGRTNKINGFHNALEDEILNDKWRFTFSNVSFFVTTFAPFYRGDHPRFSWCSKSAFIFMQPEFSFDAHGIHIDNPKRESIKSGIREEFSRSTIGYSPELVEQPMEALKYVKPLDIDAPSVRWWEVEGPTATSIVEAEALGSETSCKMKTSNRQRATDSETQLPRLSCETTSAVAERILSVAALAQQLKCTLRHSWLSNGRQESVAEHTWRMSLIALLVAPHLKVKVDITTLLKIVIVHDLVEAIAGDVPVFEVIATPESQTLKRERETEAMQQIVTMLPEINAAEIQSLWHDFESSTSNEARVAQAIDKLEAQIQHNEASLSTWLDVEKSLMNSLDTYTCFDPFLDAIRARIVAETVAKLNIGLDE